MDNHTLATNGSTTSSVNEAEIALYGFLLVLSLCGNSLVIAVVLYNENLRTPFNYLVVNIAISDLLVPLLAIPIRLAEQGLKLNQWLVDGILGTILCKLCIIITDTIASVSIFTLVIIAIERFLAISFSMRVKPLNRRRTFILIATTWIVSFAIYSPYFYFRTLVTNGDSTFCVTRPELTSKMLDFISTTTVIVFVIPCIFITVLYSMIISSIRKKSKEIVQMLESRQARSRNRQDRQVFRLSVVIILVFYVFWGPFFVYALLVSLVLKFQMQDNVYNSTAIFVVDTLGVASSSINPFIYFLFHKSYQQGLERILHRLLRKSGHRAHVVARETLKATTRYTTTL